MKKILILALGLLALTIPAVASACHVTEVAGNADCSGWELCTSVYFVSSVDEGSLEYSVTILDADGEEVTSFGETLVITHEPGAGDFEYCYSGIWDGTYQVSGATVVLTSALDGQNPTVFTFDLECTVGAEDASLGSLKSMYR